MLNRAKPAFLGLLLGLSSNALAQPGTLPAVPLNPPADAPWFNTSLPVEQRACIVLYDVEGYDYSEIAAIMHVEVGTVKSRIHRGRLALRSTLAPHRELFRG